MRSIESNYKSSMRDKDSVLFSQLINSGLIDIEANKQEIIDYYFQNMEEIEVSGVIQTLLDDNSKLKAKKEAEMRRINNKKLQEEEKIKRIRMNDKIAQEKLEQELDEEVSKTKLEIRNKQKRELSN